MKVLIKLNTAIVILFINLTCFGGGDVYFATGFKIGEVSQNSALVWTRLTEAPEANKDGVVPFPKMSKTRVFVEFPDIPVGQWEGAAPGAQGEVRLALAKTPEFSGADWTTWKPVNSSADFTHQFQLTDLDSAQRYYIQLEGRSSEGAAVTASELGSFKTAASPDEWEDVWFTVNTCQIYYQRDHPDGFQVFPAMSRLEPHFQDYPSFSVFTGDSVYYDRDNPRGKTVDLCRLHWQRMYALPLIKDYLRHVPAYWEKDDHDTFFDDCWRTYDAPWIAPLTFEEGAGVFLEQVPMSPKLYRTFRWGKGLQIWLVEGRDFRSPNDMPDGPDKTIWGKEQKEWLKSSILESDATFKILVSPTAIVGPDNSEQEDNHANPAFYSEGKEFRDWTRKNKLNNFYVTSGDRHWQYMSTDPISGLREFSCGSSSDKSVLQGPGKKLDYQSFYRSGGGFLSVSLTKGIRKVLAHPQRVIEIDGAPTITFRFHDVKGNVVYEYRDTATDS